MTQPVELAWQLDAQLGEGPIWLASEQALRFVDIKRGHLHRFDPAKGTGETLAVGGNPSFIVPHAGGGLLVGSRGSLHRLEGDRLSAPLATLPEPPGNRTNDATVDAQGRLWLGTMDDNEAAPTGNVWCWDRGSLHRAGPQAVVTNGPAISRDGNWLYHVDSGARTIWRYALGAAPVLVDGEVFIQLGEDEGFPDGVVVDAEDCLWVALWDGWAVRRYAPDGTLLSQLAMPCARPTKLAFGGPDLMTAYVTSARVGLDAAELVRQPLAGSLFSFTAPAPGRLVPDVA